MICFLSLHSFCILFTMYCSNFGGPKFSYNRSIVIKHILVTKYCITLEEN